MGTPYIVMMFMVMLLTAIAIEPLARKIRLPFGAALVLAGFGISELITSQGIDTGLRWNNFKDVITYLLIPVLVFESALKISIDELKKNLLPILILAIPLMLVSAGIIAVLLYYGINHPVGFPWVAACLTGAVLSAIDPTSVMSIFRQYHAPEKLSLMLEGESLFNDATAIILFSMILTMTMSGSLGADQVKWFDVLSRFLLIFFGGMITGASVAGVAWLFSRWVHSPVVTGVITIIIAYVSFILAEDFLHVSGVMSVLICGLVYGECLRRQEKKRRVHQSLVTPLWDVITYIAAAFLFLLAGVTITLEMFSTHWLAMMIGIFAISVARFFCILGGLAWVRGLSMRERGVVFLGGVRGTVTLALALSLPIELDYWYSVQSIAYGVVLFTLFFQAPLMPVVIRKLL